MKNILVLCLFAFAVPALHAETYVEAFRLCYRGFQCGNNFYLEQSLNELTALTIYGYDDEFYESAYIGLTHDASILLNGLQIGLGLGEARYEDDSGNRIHNVGYNPWLYYFNDGVEGYLEYEYLKNDSENYYWRGYLHKDITDHLFVGAYTERWVGNGPLIGLKFESDTIGIRFMATKPFGNEYDFEPVSAVGYVTVWFAF